MKIQFEIKWLKIPKIKKLLFTFLPFYLFTSLPLTFAQLPAGDAGDKKVVDELIHTAVNTVLKILKDKKLEKHVKKDEVRKVIDPLFDIPLMGKLVLGQKHWPKFTEAQRKEFTELFVKALQDSYFDKVDLLTDEYVEFDDPVPVGNKFQMLTHIVAKDKRYKMLFKLYRKQNFWLVYDVEIEGISFVKSYSAQYNQFLQNSSAKELLVKLREKTFDVPDDLKAKKKVEETKKK